MLLSSFKKTEFEGIFVKPKIQFYLCSKSFDLIKIVNYITRYNFN